MVQFAVLRVASAFSRPAWTPDSSFGVAIPKSCLTSLLKSVTSRQPRFPRSKAHVSEAQQPNHVM